MSKLFFIDRSWIAALVLMAAACIPAYADDALVITSDRLQVDRRENFAVFEGSVVARRGNMVLSAERMTASYEDNGSLRTLVAEGRVKLVKGIQVLTSDRVEYDLAVGSMVFTGNPRAVEEGKLLTGDSIYYYPDEDRIKVEKSTMFIETPGKGDARE